MNHQLAVREQVSDVLPISTQGITREQSRAIPEGVRNEWIAGTLYLHANPTFPHQCAIDQLRIELALQYDRDQSGSRR
ncbi:MAG: hypothetical protein AAGI34_12295 [Pseudomonadota bacterium]